MSKTKNLLSNLTREAEADITDTAFKPVETITTNEPIVTPVIKKTRRPDSQKDYKVHSFVIDLNDISYMEKFVKHMRYSGNINFTQKEALSLAISFLKKKYPEDELLNKPR
jgi:hypothetical protein